MLRLDNQIVMDRALKSWKTPNLTPTILNVLNFETLECKLKGREGITYQSEKAISHNDMISIKWKYHLCVTAM
jgi:hypothetical protein